MANLQADQPHPVEEHSYARHPHGGGQQGRVSLSSKLLVRDIIIEHLFRLRWRVADTFPDLFPSRCDSWTDLGGKIIQNPLTFSIRNNAKPIFPVQTEWTHLCLLSWGMTRRQSLWLVEGQVMWYCGTVVFW